MILNAFGTRIKVVILVKSIFKIFRKWKK